MSEGKGKSTDQTSAIPANTPLIPERQVINHARVISGFSNPHENSAAASVHKMMLSNQKKKDRLTGERGGQGILLHIQKRARTNPKMSM